MISSTVFTDGGKGEGVSPVGSVTGESVCHTETPLFIGRDR